MAAKFFAIALAGVAGNTAVQQPLAAKLAATCLDTSARVSEAMQALVGLRAAATAPQDRRRVYSTLSVWCGRFFAEELDADFASIWGTARTEQLLVRHSP